MKTRWMINSRSPRSPRYGWVLFHLVTHIPTHWILIEKKWKFARLSHWLPCNDKLTLCVSLACLFRYSRQFLRTLASTLSWSGSASPRWLSYSFDIVVGYIRGKIEWELGVYVLIWMLIFILKLGWKYAFSSAWGLYLIIYISSLFLFSASVKVCFNCEQQYKQNGK